MTNELKQKILKEISVLEIGECCGIEIGNGKGLFIQVDISIEYFIELNDIDEEYNYEPCGKYNEHSEYKNFDLLIETIDNYLKYHGINATH